MRYILLLMCLYLAIPTVSYADVFITEIMYDYEGSDGGNEWVEIHNTGPRIDISTFFFLENDIHHGLKPEGFSHLDTDQRAVIVQDLSVARKIFNNDIPIIKSSFSLNNTGEHLGVSNPEKEVISTASYSSEYGANGNGLSLQGSGMDWVEADPTPGHINTQKRSLSVESSADQKIEKKTSTQKSFTGSQSNLRENYYTPYIKFNDVALERTSTSIDAYVTQVKDGREIERIKGGIYTLNFGDGEVYESGERISIDHIYEYPGEYEVVFEFYPSRMKKEYDKDSQVRLQKTILVHKNLLEITGVDERLSIHLINNGLADIDLGDWSMYVSDKNHQYVFPKNSIVKSGASLVVPYRIHQLNDLGLDKWLVLLNKEGVTISSFSQDASKMRRLDDSRGIDLNQSTSDLGQIELTSHSEVESNLLNQDTHLERYLEQHPQKEYVDLGTVGWDQGTSDSSKNLPTGIISLFGALSLFTVGLRAYTKKNTSAPEDVLGNIELIEE